MKTSCFRVATLLLLLIAEASANIFGSGSNASITFNQYRRSYAREVLKKLNNYGVAADTFTFGRFQSPNAIDKAMSDCRSSKSFKHHSAKDGREGYYCSTRLGGDWVLAESKQVANVAKSQRKS